MYYSCVNKTLDPPTDTSEQPSRLALLPAHSSLVCVLPFCRSMHCTTLEPQKGVAGQCPEPRSAPFNPWWKRSASPVEGVREEALDLDDAAYGKETSKEAVGVQSENAEHTGDLAKQWYDFQSAVATCPETYLCPGALLGGEQKRQVVWEIYFSFEEPLPCLLPGLPKGA